MTLGTGIFLSVIIIALLTLYLKTCNRWNWKKLVKRFVIVVIVLIAGITGVIIYDDLKHDFANRPKILSSYENASFGMTREEIIYGFGEPQIADTQLTKNNQPEVYIYTTNKGQFNESNIGITFDDNDKVDSIGCYSSYEYGCDSIFGVQIGDNEESVFKKLGPPTSSEIVDKTQKRVIYEKYRIKLIFTKKILTFIQIYK